VLRPVADNEPYATAVHQHRSRLQGDASCFRGKQVCVHSPRVRIPKQLTLSWIFVVALGLGGCAGSPSKEATTNNGETSPASTDESNGAEAGDENALERYVARLCKLIIDCPVPNDDLLLPRAFFQTLAGDAYANCQAYYYDGAPSRMTEAIELRLLRDQAGALDINWDLLDEFADCSEPLRNIRQFQTAKTPAGGECQLDEECIGGYCMAQTCPGECVALLGPGEPCIEEAECFSGLCVASICAAKPEPIKGVREGMACSFLDADPGYCAAGLWCNESRVCQRPIAALAACSDIDHVCADGHLCLGGACVPLVILPVGAACAVIEDVATDELAMCNMLQLDGCVDGVCEHFGPANTGEPCMENESRSNCRPGNYCDRETGLCIALTPVGQACNSSGECDCVNGVCSEVYCDSGLR
jgi:hypothetical protein